MTRFFLALCFIAKLTAIDEPPRVELFSGYRNDRIHFHLQTPAKGILTYSELNRDVQFWENGLVFDVISKGFVFQAGVSYSGFGRGVTFQKFPLESLRFRSHTQGMAIDARAAIGLAVNLTPERFYKVILMPIVGGSCHFDQIDRNQSTLPGKLGQSFYGAFLGPNFLIQTDEGWTFRANYEYHFLHLSLNTQYQLAQQKTKIHSSSGGNLGHTGFAQLEYEVLKSWNLGLGAKINYFSSRVVPASVQDLTGKRKEKLKLRFTSVSGFIDISKSF